MITGTHSERAARVEALIQGSHAILDAAIERHIEGEGKRVAATLILFSGGNDSTVLAHMFKDRADYAAHANTTVGIEQTRQFVRDTCKAWQLPLTEQLPPRASDHYRALVLAHGFPGPGQHFKMYQRLKERSLRAIQRDLVGNPHRERIVFLAGRRRDESQRRANIPEAERIGSAVWVSPLVHWTNPDLNTYRLMHANTDSPVPVNEVSDLIHMSGECLCGSFATKGERDEISYWFPDAFDEIADLERQIAARVDIPSERRRWGWGAYRTGINVIDGQMELPESGPLCSSCDARFGVPA